MQLRSRANSNTAATVCTIPSASTTTFSMRVPKFDGKRLYTEDLDDPFVKRIRVAETTPGVTRIVFDLTGDTAINASILTSPDRLIIELRRVAAPDQHDPPPTSPPLLQLPGAASRPDCLRPRAPR